MEGENEDNEEEPELVLSARKRQKVVSTRDQKVNNLAQITRTFITRFLED